MEKDFLLTLILVRFWEIFPDLIFKWGTCLNKIYFPYFRLSEDLDFVISKNLWRSARQTLLKKYEDEIGWELQKLWLSQRAERTKYDEHKIALFTYEYISIIDNSLQTIKIDISLKWELQKSPQRHVIQSLYRDKILEEDIFSEHDISCIDLQEALAEKVRAALTRQTPAIRDFFDIWYVREFSDFDFTDPEFLRLIERKLAEVDYNYTIDWVYNILEKQIQTDLRPVLHKEYDFSLRDIYEFILNLKK
jgi:predicted nucleotidyltransferase component of viral defense system